MRTEPVWITGVGTLSSLGADYRTFADQVLAGKCGIRRLEIPDADRSVAWPAAALDTIPAPPGWDAAEFAALNRLHQVALYCCAQALHDAGLWEQRANLRIGLVLGMGAEWARVWELDGLAHGLGIANPEQEHVSLVGCLKQTLGLAGPVATVAAACASGNYALAQASRWVQMGWADVCLAGGCDLITPMALGGFGNLRALSRRVDQPAAAARPFDADRDGFVMGEGGAVLVLEPAAAAARRGALARAEIAGFGASSDASHMIIPSTDPAPAVKAMRQAFAEAEIRPEEVDYLNAHAAGTPVGDRAETRVIKLVLGEAAAQVPVSSTKSMTGHLLSGAAAIEAVACLVALERQALPPTINLDHPDPECDLHHVPNQARAQRVRIAVSNSTGFGGSNTCLVLRQVA